MKFPYHDKKHGVWINANGEGKVVAISDEAFNSPEPEQKEVTKGVCEVLFDEFSIE